MLNQILKEIAKSLIDTVEVIADSDLGIIELFLNGKTKILKITEPISEIAHYYNTKFVLLFINNPDNIKPIIKNCVENNLIILAVITYNDNVYRICQKLNVKCYLVQYEKILNFLLKWTNMC